jgi:hypothetical protein
MRAGILLLAAATLLVYSFYDVVEANWDGDHDRRG